MLHALNNSEKLTVLMFDEIKVSSFMEYDVRHDEVVGPHNQMQLIMARGLASQWKQPIYVDFDKKMTKGILFDIIERLDQIGYKVVCCISDCDGGNVGLWKALNISYENPIFSTPNGRDIVYIPDAPHILKLIRNWLLDTGFQINDQIINKKPLEALVRNMSTELSVCHKLTSEHLTCDGPLRQKVRLATQLLSHTTATALKHYKPITDIKLLNNTANFIELVNNWFDLANVSHTNDKHSPYTAPYGLLIDEQDALLDNVYDIFLKMRCNGKKSLQIFQKALLMNINGTKHLLKILQQNGLEYLLTSKVNQDALENLYSQIRSRGGLNDHPSPLNALYRLRMIILGKNPGVVSNHANTTDKNKEEFMVASTLKKINFSISNERENTDNSETDTDTNDYLSDTDESSISSEKQCVNKLEMTNDAVEYLAGWIAKKYQLKFPELGSITSKSSYDKSSHEHNYSVPSWISHLSYGGLIVPSNNFKTNILRIERLFKKITKQQIPKGLGVVKNLTKKIISRIDMEKKYNIVIQSYIKQRILIRMKYYNKQHTLKSKFRLQKLQKLRRLMT